MNKMVFERFMIVSNRSSVVTSYMSILSGILGGIFSGILGGYIRWYTRWIYSADTERFSYNGSSRIDTEYNTFLFQDEIDKRNMYKNN